MIQINFSIKKKYKTVHFFQTCVNSFLLIDDDFTSIGVEK
jgi:hypothetical protein